MIRSSTIVPMSLKEEELDMPLGVGSGAGVIFGATGGVMEAGRRTVAEGLSGESVAEDSYSVVRGTDGIKRAEVELSLIHS